MDARTLHIWNQIMNIFVMVYLMVIKLKMFKIYIKNKNSVNQ